MIEFFFLINKYFEKFNVLAKRKKKFDNIFFFFFLIYCYF
jgi:hypothetical protein